MADSYRQLRANIRRYGRTVIGVFPDRDSPDPTNDAFAYTVGNGLRSLPELLVIGMFGQTAIMDAQLTVRGHAQARSCLRRWRDGEFRRQISGDGLRRQ
jgi:hypothetical protein